MLDSSEWRIYRWINLINGKQYHGQDKSGVRIDQHHWCIEHNCPERGGCGGSSKLHKAVRAYGIDSFKIETVETGFCSKDEIDRVEDSYIETSLAPNGYNSRTNEHAQGGIETRGSRSPEEEEIGRILDYLTTETPDLPEEFSYGFQPIKIRTRKREIPEWALDDEKVREMLLSAFPGISRSKKVRARAGRWMRVIQLYYRMALPAQIVAKEVGITEKELEFILVRMNRVANGQRADGTGPRTRNTKDTESK